MLNLAHQAEAYSLLKDLVEKFQGQNGESWIKATERFLGKQDPWPDLSKFKTWKKIRLGGYETLSYLRETLENKFWKFCVTDDALQIFHIADFSYRNIEIKLVRFSVAELGFKNAAYPEQIYKRAGELGLELCPPEVGPQLRLKYKNQPVDEHIIVAMNPVVFPYKEGHYVFSVENNGSQLWLATKDIRINMFSHESQWIFWNPRS